MFLRFFLPRTIFEPSAVFKIGFPRDYALGVDTKWQQQYRIWVDKTSDRLFVVYARCTHLGCTPDWKASENKFKCPCHGSGYDSEGLTLKVLRRGRWIARTSNSMRKGKSWWTSPSFISGKGRKK
jgi:cytochrome b6-f complex iron-sulfur subunit